MALIPPFFLDCVVAIGFRGADGGVSYAATGFLYGHVDTQNGKTKEPTYYGYLVTNRHVFEGERRAILRFNPGAGAPAKVYDLDLQGVAGERLWSVHPREGVDAAAIAINTQILREEGIEHGYFYIDHHVMTSAIAVSEGLTEGDGLFILGFPLGDVGGERNYVIVRHGVVARIRDMLAGKSDWILADATVFPGNSGGPAVTHPEPISITGTKAPSKAYLLGMVSSYVPFLDVAISQQTRRPRVTFEENTGITRLVPFTHITETVEVAHNRQIKLLGSK